MSALPYEGVSDDWLVEQARAGDKAAFTELVRRHQNAVFGLALRLTGDPELAADASQEALVRAWRALPGFRGEAAITTWLHRITVNTVWTHRHRARSRRTEPIDDIAHLLVASDLQHPVRSLESMELADRIRVALDTLPPGRRAVVVMKDIYGWSHADISQALGISVPATKVKLHRARLQLQNLLEDAR
jgi:RNA polymerase sigma-70 factor, ECF subfamily